MSIRQAESASWLGSTPLPWTMYGNRGPRLKSWRVDEPLAPLVLPIKGVEAPA